MKFQAPAAKGSYQYILHVRSDSYIDADYQVDVKVDVQQAREPVQVKYADTEDEADANQSEELSEYTEGSDSEED